MPFLARNVLNSSGSSTVPACVGVAGSVFGVAEGEGLGGAAGVSLALVLGVGLGDAVAEVVGVEDKEGLDEGEGLIVVEADVVELADGEAVSAFDGETDGSGVTEGDGDVDLVAKGVGDVIGLGMATPLFQTSFLPDLTQVNFLPL